MQRKSMRSQNMHKEKGKQGKGKKKGNARSVCTDEKRRSPHNTDDYVGGNERICRFEKG